MPYYISLILKNNIKKNNGLFKQNCLNISILKWVKWAKIK